MIGAKFPGRGRLQLVPVLLLWAWHLERGHRNGANSRLPVSCQRPPYQPMGEGANASHPDACATMTSATPKSGYPPKTWTWPDIHDRQDRPSPPPPSCCCCIALGSEIALQLSKTAYMNCTGQSIYSVLRPRMLGTYSLRVTMSHAPVNVRQSHHVPAVGQQ